MDNSNTSLIMEDHILHEFPYLFPSVRIFLSQVPIKNSVPGLLVLISLSTFLHFLKTSEVWSNIGMVLFRIPYYAVLPKFVSFFSTAKTDYEMKGRKNQ